MRYQSAVTQNQWNTINEKKVMLGFEIKELHIVLKYWIDVSAVLCHKNLLALCCAIITLNLIYKSCFKKHISSIWSFYPSINKRSDGTGGLRWWRRSATHRQVSIYAILVVVDVEILMRIAMWWGTRMQGDWWVKMATIEGSICCWDWTTIYRDCF